MVIEFGSYQLDDEATRVDRDAVWSFLSSQAYWGRWRTRQDVERQLDTAWRVVGVYDTAGDGWMVGFARAISDGVAFAYLADTYIVDTARRQGLGKELVRVMIDCGPGVSFRWTLHTADAHGLYEQFGFIRPDHTYLERIPRDRLAQKSPRPP
ncbi:MAG: GNAT family N-acetyltransferase [Pseudonocardiales bacterium]|nr:MAG: GNAT family N-acetyltransferase [Pseudonocardiales bacterium]